ncbi:uncharacterized protein V6R79_000280 [Siganus canaliculatus]
MKGSSTLLCLLFLLLQDEITSFTSAIRILTRKEGEDFTYKCSLFFDGGRRLFCKNTCKGNNVLIDTALNFYQRGRYTIRYKEAEGAFSESSLFVTITNLTTSDSGRYRCSTIGGWRPDSLEDFELRVEEVPELHTSPGPYSASPPPRTTTQGLTRPSSGTTETTEKSKQEQRPAGSVVALFVRPAVVVVVIVASAAVLLFCWRRSRKPGAGFFSERRVSLQNLPSRQRAREWQSSTIRRRNHGADVLLQKHHEFKQDRAVLQDEITSFPSFTSFTSFTSFISFPSAIRNLTGKEGEDFTYKCSFFFNGGRRLFCKNTCKGNNVLIDTKRNFSQRGRYKIRYEKAKDLTSYSFLYVSITKLTTSDSGRYRCSSVRDWRPDSSEEFELKVVGVPTASTPTTPGRPSTSSSSASLASTLTTTHSFTWSSSSSPPSSASPKTTEESEQIDTRAGPGLLLYPGLTVVVLSAAVWILIRRRRSKAREPPHPGERDSAPVAPPLYEDVRDTHSSAAAQISTVYVCAKYTKADSSGTTGDYSYVTAAGLHTDTEDDSSKLNYSEVVFPGRAAAPNSAPCGAADEVLYSVPRVAASSEAKSSTAVPLYSTVGTRRHLNAV